MASADWTDAGNVADDSTIRRGASAGFPKPNGGGTFSYGFKSISNATGVVARYVNLAGFTPAAKGMDISAAIQIGPGSGAGKCSAFIFASMNNTDVSGVGYLLGLSNGDTPHLILRKGDIASGLPDVAPGSQGVLRRSVETFAAEEFWHLRLQCVKNTNGDLVINVLMSDLGAHAVSSPSWVAVAGMDQFIDDQLGIASGSVPILSGYTGHGMRSEDVGRVSYIEYIQLARQL
jgi:hypothetical protein